MIRKRLCIWGGCWGTAGLLALASQLPSTHSGRRRTLDPLLRETGKAVFPSVWAELCQLCLSPAYASLGWGIGVYTGFLNLVPSHKGLGREGGPQAGLGGEGGPLRRVGFLSPAFLLPISQVVASFWRCRAWTFEQKQSPKLFGPSGSRQMLDLRAEVFGSPRDLCWEARGDWEKWAQCLGLLFREGWVPRCPQSTLGTLKKTALLSKHLVNELY